MPRALENRSWRPPCATRGLGLGLSAKGKMTLEEVTLAQTFEGLFLASVCSFTKDRRMIEQGTEQPRQLFDDWKQAVQAIGHPEFPFLSVEFSPDRCIPCRGFVEWITDALVVGEVDSIARLFCEILGAIPAPWSRGSDPRERFLTLPHDFCHINLEGTIVGLDSRQLSALLSAYMLQATIAGYQEEFILVSPGRFLLAATVLPWDFEIAIAADCIRRVNGFIKRMRKDTPFWRDIPLFKVQDIAPFDTAALQSLMRLRQGLVRLSVAARMHLLDAISDCRGRFAQRPLSACASMETRGFGCNTSETCDELLASGLIEREVDLRAFHKWFTKSELQEMPLQRGVHFNKSARHAELFSLALDRTPEQIRSEAHEKGVFVLAEETYEVRGVLIDFYHHEASRLAVWIAGGLLPRLREVREARGTFVGG